MPVLSNYWFDETDFRGTTEFLSIGHGAGIWAWINWSDIGSTKSTLVWEREDREVVIDPAPFLNDPATVSSIASMLGSSVSLTSGINAGWIPWRYVPYHDSDPTRFGDLDLLVRVFFNFHVSVPWYCFSGGADGNIAYYVVPYLDGSGHVGAYVDGWSYHFDGGGLCSGSISDRLNSAVPGGITTVQSKLDSLIAPFASLTFDLLYLLPGSGDKSGVGNTNVDEHVSVALLPRS